MNTPASTKVEQRHRLAAHDAYFDCNDTPPNELWLLALLDGKHDDDPLVKAFAGFEASLGRNVDATPSLPIELHRLPSVLREHVTAVLRCEAEPHVIEDAIRIVQQAADVIERRLSAIAPGGAASVELREALEYAVDAVGKEADHAMKVTRAARYVVEEIEAKEARFKKLLAALATSSPVDAEKVRSEHVGRLVPVGERKHDQYVCSCGWKSETWQDGPEWAEAAWLKHFADAQAAAKYKARNFPEAPSHIGNGGEAEPVHVGSHFGNGGACDPLEGEKLAEAFTLLKMLIASEDEARSHGGVADCVDNQGHHYQSEAFEGLITHARMLVSPYDHKAAMAAHRAALPEATTTAGKSGEDARSQHADARLRALREEAAKVADRYVRPIRFETGEREADDAMAIREDTALKIAAAIRALALGAGER